MSFKSVKLFFSGVGLILIVVGLLIYRQTANFVQIAQKATGTITNIISHGNLSSGRATYPVITFTTETGQVIEFKQSTGSGITHYIIGQTIPILYDPKSPSTAKSDTFIDLWMAPTALIGLGLIFVIIMVFGRMRSVSTTVFNKTNTKLVANNES